VNRIISRAIFLVATALFSTVTFGATPETREIMKVGYFVLEPHALAESETLEPSGAAVDYMEQYIAPRMNVSIEWSLLPFSRLMRYLDSGKIDAVLLLGKNPERIEKYLYPEKPVTLEATGFALKNSYPLTQIKSVEDLKNVQVGFTKNGYISPFMRDENIQFDFITGNERYLWQRFLKQLVAGRIDAVYNPSLTVLKYNAKKLGLSEKLRFIELPEPPIGLYTVFSKSAGGFLRRYNSAHTDLIRSNNYATLQKKYLE